MDAFRGYLVKVTLSSVAPKESLMKRMLTDGTKFFQRVSKKFMKREDEKGAKYVYSLNCIKPIGKKNPKRDNLITAEIFLSLAFIETSETLKEHRFSIFF